MQQTFHMPDIHLFNILKSRIGEKEAEQLIGFVKSEIDMQVHKKSETIDKNNIAMKEELNKTFSTKEEISKLGITIAKLEATIARTESKLLIWAFVFWATQLGGTLAFMKLFVK